MVDLHAPKAPGKAVKLTEPVSAQLVGGGPLCSTVGAADERVVVGTNARLASDGGASARASSGAVAGGGQSRGRVNPSALASRHNAARSTSTMRGRLDSAGSIASASPIGVSARRRSLQRADDVAQERLVAVVVKAAKTSSSLPCSSISSRRCSAWSATVRNAAITLPTVGTSAEQGTGAYARRRAESAV